MSEVPSAPEVEESRRELLRQRDLLRARPRAAAAESYPDRFDRAAYLYQHSADVSLKNQASSQLDKITAALTRIAIGEYGVCAECGEPVGMRRLRVNPAAIYCLACQYIVNRREYLESHKLEP